MSERTAAFVGFGQSSVFRHDDVPLGELAVEACRAAVTDAGLELSQIDGVVCTPDIPFSIEGGVVDGVHYLSTDYVARSLGVTPRWSSEVRGTLGNSAIEAIRGVEAGRCDYALLFRALHSPAGRYGHTRVEQAVGSDQFTAPYGVFPPASSAALSWSRYQQKYNSGSREQMAAYVTQERHNGLMYEGGYWAQYRPTELSVDDYLNARIVATPVSIFDSDLPVQGAGAFIVTTAERAMDLPQRQAHVRGVSLADTAPSYAYIRTLEAQLEYGRSMAKGLWADSSLGPSDVKVADLYDGFSMITICWLESLGFCGEGEAFDFIQEGRIANDGVLPLNPSGGNLGCGRLHGVNHLMDAMLQVTGRSGSRQVANADIALAAIGPASSIAGLILLGQDPR